MADIETLNDIQKLVDTFYEQVREDELLGPIFQEVVQDRWPQHLAKMYQFWQTILLEEHTYNGRPFPPHAFLPVDQRHFDRWVSLFQGTVQQFFEGSKATEAQSRAAKMGQLFHAKVQFVQQQLKDQSSEPPSSPTT